MKHSNTSWIIFFLYCELLAKYRDFSYHCWNSCADLRQFIAEPHQIWQKCSWMKPDEAVCFGFALLLPLLNGSTFSNGNGTKSGDNGSY